MSKYIAKFYFGTIEKPDFAHQEVVDFPRHEVSVIAPTGTGKRWVYTLERQVTEGLDIPELAYKFKEEAMTAAPLDRDGLRQQLQTLDIEFLPHVPVNLPDVAVDAIMQLAEEYARSVEQQARDSEQNRLFAVLRHLGIPHDAKAIVKVRRQWDAIAEAERLRKETRLQ